MKQYQFKVQMIFWSFAFVLMAAFLSGCGPLDQKRIAGRYTRRHMGITDSLLLNQDGTFQQSIGDGNGATWNISGSWKVINRVIQLDKCYLSFDDEKQINIVPPMIVYSCTFSISGDDLIRTKLQPPWNRVGRKN